MLSAAAAGFDVAIAADFSSPKGAVRAEVQTLFFLASWLENTSPQTRASCPLHLACVLRGGNVPDSVATLAERAGARVALHEPLLVRLPDGEREFNRLRALDAGPFTTARLLLLDTGTLVLGDPRLALAGIPEDVLSSSPADRALLPDAAWPPLYGALHLSTPTTRIRALRAELELPPRDGAPTFENQGPQSADMLPCYDPGVLLLPAGAATALRELWPEHFVRVAERLMKDGSLPLSDTARTRLAANPRLSLATAHQALLAGGHAPGGWRRLPRGCDARLVHFQGGALELKQVKLLRAGGFFQDVTDPSQTQGQLRAAAGLWRSVIVEGRQRNAGADLWAGDGFPARWRRWRAHRAGWRAEHWLRGLYARHVRPSLRAAGEYV